MAYVPLAVAGVSALSGYLGANKQRKAAAQREAQLQRRASPEHLMEIIQKLAPFYRELVNAGLGPRFLQESARAISEAGLSGTGVGEAMRQISKTAPSATATAMATEAGQSTVNNELSALGGAPMYTGNPLAEALMAGARGYAGASEALRARNAQERDALVQRHDPMYPQPTTLPVQYPKGPLPGEPDLFPTPNLNPLERPGVNI